MDRQCSSAQAVYDSMEPALDNFREEGIREQFLLGGDRDLREVIDDAAIAYMAALVMFPNDRQRIADSLAKVLDRALNDKVTQIIRESDDHEAI